MSKSDINEKETKECACRHSESTKALAHVASIMPNDHKKQKKAASERLRAERLCTVVERKAVHLKTH